MQKVVPALQSLLKLVTSVNSFFLLAMTVAMTLAVLPFGDNFLIDSKAVLIFVMALGVALLWTASIIRRKSLQITLSSFFLPLLALFITTLISSFLSPSLPVVQLFGMGGIYLAVTLTALIGPSLLQQKRANLFLPVLLVAASILAISGAAELLNAGPSRFANTLLKTNFPSSPVFSISGSPLIALQVILLALAGIGGLVWVQRKKASPLLVAAVFPLLLGLGANARTLYQAQKDSALFLPYGINLSVAIDSLKSVKTAVIGEGPESFLQTYLRLKPETANLTKVWNLQFNQGSNMPLTLVPTMGLVGLAAWLFLFIQVIRRYRVVSDEARPVATVALATFILQLIFPPNIVILALQALALLFWVVAEKDALKDIQLHAFTVHIIKSGSEVQRIPKHSNMMVYIISALNLLLIAFLGVWITRYAVAQYFNFSANMAVVENDLIKVYQRQQQMIAWNKYIPAYHRAYSLTNLNIAVAYSTAQNATDEQRQQAVTLVQQSIREARSAIFLEPANSLNWVNLGRVYSNLIGAAEGADVWAIDSYAQAQALAINDPILSIEIGGLLFRTNRVADSVKVFERTVTLKPDWAPAYYNLAVAYRQNQELQKSVGAYQQTLALLTPGSDDYNKVDQELKQLQGQLNPTKTTESSDASKAKQPAPSPSATPSAAPSSLEVPEVASPTGSLSPETKAALKNTDLENP